MTAFTYTRTCEDVPAQAEGRYDRSQRPYYFRARHGTWHLLVGQTGYPDDYCDWPHEGLTVNHFEGPDAQHGWDWTDDQIRRVIGAAEDAL